MKLKKLTGPPWYRELSSSQITSADGLQNSLHDDLEILSTSKTRALISNLGLSPLPNKKNLSLAMDMSRGNDLAFLWFLNETVYNTQNLQEERTDYTENEKIILSSIAHLDMVTTLRELDRILPKLQKKPKPYSEQKRILRAKKIIYASPYLEPLTRPKIPVSRIYLPLKLRRIPVTPYEIYKDRTYIPPNAKNRWYAIKTRVKPDINREAILKSVCNSESPTDFEQRKDQIFEYFLELTKCQRYKRTHVIYQVDLYNADTVGEFEKVARQYQKQMIVKTIVRDLLQNALNVQKLRACSKTIDCMNDYEKYLSVLERNMKPRCEDIKYFNVGECKFDYDKIFNDETFQQKQSENGYLAGEIDKRVNGKCTDVCMRNLFCLEIPLWAKPSFGEQENCKDKNMDEDGDEIESVHPSVIDPNDPEQVLHELEVALNKMKKNPKFVLASIPLAAEVPMLVEFTFQRYGRTFSGRERLKLFKKRDMQFELLKKAKINIHPPKGEVISENKSRITWDQQGWLMRRTNEVLENYYDRVKIHFLEQSRLFWPILVPYLCTDGLPREVFYSYLPSNKKHIYPFRPWRDEDNKGDKKKL